MLILLAESKAMSALCGEAAPTTGVTTPMFLPQAEAIMDGLRGRSAAQLAATFKMGPKNAERLYEEIYDFPNRTTGTRAIDAYTGVVFRALDASTLTPEAAERLASTVLIVSSLYGLLRPTDLIKSYRLDFGLKAAPSTTVATSTSPQALSAFWKTLLTDALLAHLARTGESELLNLLPADAAKCFDWARIAPHATIHIPTFTSGRTPHATELKRLRGSLLRQLLTDPTLSLGSIL